MNKRSLYCDTGRIKSVVIACYVNVLYKTDSDAIQREAHVVSNVRRSSTSALMQQDGPDHHGLTF